MGPTTDQNSCHNFLPENLLRSGATILGGKGGQFSFSFSSVCVGAGSCLVALAKRLAWAREREAWDFFTSPC